MIQLQLLLGFDKSKPLIDILINPKLPDEAYVYLGTHLLEKVHLGKDSVEAKLLAGRLYNAGFKRKTLTDKFEWDLKTIRGYGDALKDGSSEGLARALNGQGAARKVDETVELFIRQTFREIYASEKSHSNAFIRNELLNKQNIDLSHETVRLIINDEFNRRNNNTGIDDVEPAHDEISDKSHAILNEIDAVIPVNKEPVIDGSATTARENGCNSQHSLGSTLPKSCKYSPSSSRSEPVRLEQPKSDAGALQTILLHHGGLFLIRALLDMSTSHLGAMRNIVRQWVVATLCNCSNIEQMGALNFPSLEVIVGPQEKAISKQREILLQSSSAEAIAKVRRENLDFLGVKRKPLAFLYDPHGIKYTGQLKLLKGWLGGSHQIDKAYYQDFIHTLDGKPMVAFLDDNRSTLIKRFPSNIDNLRELLNVPPKHPITLTVDRAIYSLPELIRFRDELNIFIVTWEKNHTRQPWNPLDSDMIKRIYIPKYRNHNKDSIMYKVEYYSRQWSRDSSLKQYIIRIYKGSNAEPVTLSILSTCPDDFNFNATAQIESILTRWVQENNIGYLIVHNGINEITSYQKFTYDQAAKKLNLDDYLSDNPKLRRLVSQKLKIKHKKASLYIKIEDRQEFYERDHESKTNELVKVERQLKTKVSPDKIKILKKRLASLRRNLKTMPDRKQCFLDKSNNKQNSTI